MNDTDPDFLDKLDRHTQDHQDQLAGAFLWGLSIGIATGALLVFFAYLLL